MAVRRNLRHDHVLLRQQQRNWRCRLLAGSSEQVQTTRRPSGRTSCRHHFSVWAGAFISCYPPHTHMLSEPVRLVLVIVILPSPKLFWTGAIISCDTNPSLPYPPRLNCLGFFSQSPSHLPLRQNWCVHFLQQSYPAPPPSNLVRSFLEAIPLLIWFVHWFISCNNPHSRPVPFLTAMIVSPIWTGSNYVTLLRHLSNTRKSFNITENLAGLHGVVVVFARLHSATKNVAGLHSVLKT